MLDTLRTLLGTADTTTRANDPLGGALRMLQPDRGVGSEWQPTAYGEYYARSPDIYAAVKLRAQAVARPPLLVRRRDASGTSVPVGPDHPVQRLLDSVNGWGTSVDLPVATEAYLGLWGAPFGFLGHSGRGGGGPHRAGARRPGRSCMPLWQPRPTRPLA